MRGLGLPKNAPLDTALSQTCDWLSLSTWSREWPRPRIENRSGKGSSM